jgi:hypothetical protein
MSTEEMHRSFSDIVRAATALEGAKPRVGVIIPWRVNTNRDHLYKGLDGCGCGFCPDDDQETT